MGGSASTQGCPWGGVPMVLNDESDVPVMLRRPPEKEEKCGYETVKFKVNHKGLEKISDFESKTFENNGKVWISLCCGDDNYKEVDISLNSQKLAKCYRNGGHSGHIFTTSVRNPSWLKINGNQKAKVIAKYDYSHLELSPFFYVWTKSFQPIRRTVYIRQCQGSNQLILSIYPFKKWNVKLKFKVNNNLKMRYANAKTAADLKRLRSESGKIGAEKRWKETGTTFSLNAKLQYDKDTSGNYTREKKLDLEYKRKYKSIFNLLAKAEGLIGWIMEKTGGKICKASKTTGLGNIPVAFVITPPSIELDLSWESKYKKFKVYEDFDGKIAFSPLIGLKLTVDLLGWIVVAASGAITGGSATPGAVKAYNWIKNKISEGYDGDHLKISGDIYLNLIFSGDLDVEMDPQFKSWGNSNIKGTGKFKVGVKLEGGAYFKGSLTVLEVEFKGKAGAKASGSSGIELKLGARGGTAGLKLLSTLEFKGVTVTYKFYADFGLGSISGGESTSGGDKIVSASTLWDSSFEIV